ncbi:DUF2612 domain-containing protein [Commensalibacter papalotli (ex Servin-Garciduenas et al. 2014)]|uniref:Putative bacteriophage protein n=1 Tax=Commensalibacter papalotli (ex Servin-Garciduenas et al. 2014) TaxID=1208583 RepID=W7DX91_9PROT|nr:DUF2612 domain-containing protein [Commensalibacter papalotli (ex Servin-Garciduenas et al. 2014)]EUK18818.1 putative bacteriophage protein [Commensalibacter papalotli (ex Servin-Garciduenas et al. 2014)]
MASNLVFDPDNPPPCLNPDITVIAQYANSPNILTLIHNFSLNIKVCGFFTDFYNNIWNLNTANAHGLDIWGIIVGVNRTVKTFTGFFWGFNEETLLLARPYHDITGYNDSLTNDEDRRTAIGTFRDFQELEGEITFNDENFRKLIWAKAHANIGNYTSSDLNKILMLLFGDKEKGHELYVQDNQDMSMTIVFNFLPTSDEVAIILNAGILFKPAGVELKVDFQIKN